MIDRSLESRPSLDGLVLLGTSGASMVDVDDVVKAAVLDLFLNELVHVHVVYVPGFFSPG